MLAQPVRRVALICAFVFMTSLGSAQDPSDGRGPATPPQGAAREAMWPAPTAEDWKKPVLITFQRTWKDALEVSKRSNKPILICINMDGEIASEHYAGIKYRDARDTRSTLRALRVRHRVRLPSQHRATTTNTVIAFCAHGFGSVTCGEHICDRAAHLYEKYMRRATRSRRGTSCPRASTGEGDLRHLLRLERHQVGVRRRSEGGVREVEGGDAHHRSCGVIGPVRRARREPRTSPDRKAVEKAYRERRQDSCARQLLEAALKANPDAAPARSVAAQ